MHQPEGRGNYEGNAGEIVGGKETSNLSEAARKGRKRGKPLEEILSLAKDVFDYRRRLGPYT